MPAKKKAKNYKQSKCALFIQMDDGSYSLVITPKKSAIPQVTNAFAVNTNKLKKVIKKDKDGKQKKGVDKIEKVFDAIIDADSDASSQTQYSYEIQQTADVPKTEDDAVEEGSSDAVSKSEDNTTIDEPLNGLCLKQTVEEQNTDDTDSEDDFDYDNLFNTTNAEPQPTYISVPTDTFPYAFDSDNEEDAYSETIKFRYSKSRQLAMAEYEDNEYRIGYLDLTNDESNYLKMISETHVFLNFNLRNIVISGNKLNVKRIIARETRSSSINECFFERLNMGRVLFSKTEPFLASYDNEIHFVEHGLYEEYTKLLERTGMSPGTAIRIKNNRLIEDLSLNSLDTLNNLNLNKLEEVCVLPGSSENDIQAFIEQQSKEFQRFIVRNNPCEIIKVDPILIHTTASDEITEIYAGIDFPFKSTECVQKLEVVQAKVQKAKEPINEVIDPEEESLEMMQLRAYPPLSQIEHLVNGNKLSKSQLAATQYGALCKKESLRTTQPDYIAGYRMMIHLEELENERYLQTFNQSNITILNHMDRTYYFPLTDALSELVCAIDEGLVDYFTLIPAAKLPKNKEIWGKVLRVRERKIMLEIFQESSKTMRQIYKNEIFDISFRLNRVPYQLQHLALDFIVEQHLFPRLINNSLYKCKISNNVREHVKLKTEDTYFSNLNAEQQSAVENIVSIPTEKVPYILFGPPGTGKTRTLVAAIEQIVKTTKKNVLVCAMSNAACDEITERLINVLEDGELYRFYAKSYKYESAKAKFKRVSNFGSQGIFYPSLKYIYQFRVFVCTLCSAGCLTRARIDKEVWRPTHFDYVFIDECASAHETMSLIPIAGLCTSTRKIHARIVLAGDPKQLDAVTRSERAKTLGYGTSWLEQLCETNLYKRDSITGNYNERFITQLVKNYRSHPHILKVPNELFYDSTLEPCAAQRDINWYINSKYLPSKQFPVIFRSVQGVCERSVEQSWYNVKEVEEVISVIKQLLPPKAQKMGLKRITQSDIGVVTPYRKQRQKLVQKFRRINLDEVAVGTAEIFQGKEKPIMIISTVRSNGSLGFVDDPRRLNVVITRAKCLLVIIGDPHTLKLDGNWRRVMNYCLEHNSFIQSNEIYGI